MTQRRVFLHEYTEREVREMPAGALLDWLLDQHVRGSQVYVGLHVNGRESTRCHMLESDRWFLNRDQPEGRGLPRYSSDWAHCGLLLYQMMRENGAFLHQPPDNGGKVFWCEWGRDMCHDLVGAPTPQLAIARASVILALRKLAASRQPGAAEEGTE
jgi:hypothetical protein